MKKILLGSTVLLGVAVSATVWAQGAAPKSSTTITTEDVQKVLKLGPKETDHTIKVVDMGQGYQMAVGIVHRGSTRNRPAPSPQAAAARAAAQAKLAACAGTPASAPAGAKIGPANGMLVHDDTAETYIITKGGGTLVTGGTLFGAKRDAADSPMTTTLNGPSCTGKVYGDFKVQTVKVGDIVIIPAGVPHGWSDIPQMVDYLSVRPDPKHVLPKAGFTYPGL